MTPEAAFARCAPCDAVRVAVHERVAHVAGGLWAVERVCRCGAPAADLVPLTWEERAGRPMPGPATLPVRAVPDGWPRR
jgi:hypothetical protein